MAVSIRGIPAAFVVNPADSASIVSAAFVYAQRAILFGHPVHPVCLSLNDSSSYNIQVPLVTGQIPRHHATDPTLPPTVLSLGRDWLRGFVNTCHTGDMDSGLHALRQSGITIVNATLNSPVSVAGSRSTSLPVSGVSPSTPYLNPAQSSSQPSHAFAAQPNWLPYGSSEHQQRSTTYTFASSGNGTHSNWSQYGASSQSHSYSSGLNPGQSSLTSSAALPALTSYLVQRVGNARFVFSMTLQQILMELQSHGISTLPSTLGECRRILLQHLVSGRCSNNIREDTSSFSASACFHVSQDYESAVQQSYVAVSLLLSHFVSPEPSVVELISSALGFPDDLGPTEFRKRLHNEQKDLQSQCTDLDIGSVLLSLHNCDKCTLQSMAESHGVKLPTRCTKEGIIDMIISHLTKGACSPPTLGRFPVGCAHAASVFDVDEGTLTPDSTEMSVAMLLLMAKRLKTRKLLEKLSADLDLPTSSSMTFNQLRRGIRNYAVRLRKSKQVRLCAATCTTTETREETATRWPEIVSEENREEYMNRFDAVVQSLSGRTFTCCCCAARKGRRDQRTVKFRDLDFSLLLRPDRAKLKVQQDMLNRLAREEADIDMSDVFDTYHRNADSPHIHPSELGLVETPERDESDLGTGFSSEVVEPPQRQNPISDDDEDGEDAAPPSHSLPDPVSESPWLSPGYDIDDSPFPQHDELKDLLLDPNGVRLDEDHNHIMTLCVLCHTTLGKGKLPKFSLANKLYLGSVPTELQELSPIEEKMIARCQNVAYVVKLHGEGQAAQRAVKGHVIVYPQQSSAVINMLPPSIDDLTKPVCVIFVGSKPPTAEWLKKKARPLLIRPEKVRAALLWLVEHNPLYKDVKVNHALLDSLPDESILPVHVEHVVSSRQTDPFTAGYDPSMFQVDRDPDEEIDFHRVVVTDVEARASSHAMKSAALRHLKNRNGGYLEVPHDRGAASEFNNPDLYPMIYPTLFPYGIGGLDDPSRPVQVGVKTHLRHLFNLNDQRFQRHYSFLFTAFNMLQRHEMLRKTSSLMKRSSFRQHSESWVEVDPLTVHIVSERIARGDPVTANTAEEKKVLDLMHEIKVVTSSVSGSASSRLNMRNEIRSMIMSHGLPSFYVTINPADVYNPLVSVLAGQALDVEDFLARDFLFESSSSTKPYQGIEIAKNPFLGARFFDIMMKAFIKGLLGFDPNNPSTKGVLGKVKGYYGCIEAQGRGTLHCHMLIWVEGALSPDELRTKLTSDEEFKRKLFDYLEDTIRTSIPELLPEDGVPHIPPNTTERNPCTVPRLRRSAGQRQHEFRRARRVDLRNIVARCQSHVHSESCYKYCPPGGPYICRFDLDPEKYNERTVFSPESGEIIPQCLDGMVNNYNPTIVEAMRNNMDIKFIGSGGAAKAILYYITDYITKSQLKAHVAFSAVDWAVGKTGRFDPSLSSKEKHAKLLLNRCAYAVLGNQELSAPQVASYLLGNKDHYTSHSFRPLFWTNFENYIDKQLHSPECYPAKETNSALEDAPSPGQANRSVEDQNEPDSASSPLRNPDEVKTVGEDGCVSQDTGDSPHNDRDHVEPVEDGDILGDEDNRDHNDEPAEQPSGTDYNPQYSAEDGEELVRLGPGRKKTGELIEQPTALTDYLHRSEVIENVSVWDFIGQVDKVKKTKTKRAATEEDEESDSGEDNESEHGFDGPEEGIEVEVLCDSERSRPSGDMLSTHPQFETHHQVVRRPDNRLVPQALGPAIPRRDRLASKEKHARLMLVLFKPWRSVKDLRGNHDSWTDAYSEWLQSCSPRIKSIIDNMQVLHECRDSRDTRFDDRRAAWRRNRLTSTKKKNPEHIGQVDDDALLEHLQKLENQQSLRASSTSAKIADCRYHAATANMFSFEDRSVLEGPCSDAGHNTVKQIRDEEATSLESVWRADYDRKKQDAVEAWCQVDTDTQLPRESVSRVATLQDGSAWRDAMNMESNALATERTPGVVIPPTVNLPAAEDLITEITRKYSLNSEQHRAFRIIALHSLDSQLHPLRMFLGGAGGTGKSTVIRALTDFLECRGQGRRLRLTSYTGVAARNVRGLTLHSALSLNMLRRIGASNKARETLATYWQGVDYVVVDEVSMVGCSFMADISEALCIARGNNEPFGGINIIFAGDFAQLSPVGDTRLYKRLTTSKGLVGKRDQKNAFGKLLWYSVETVVMLTEVCRSKDPRLTDILSRVRDGRCTQNDYYALCSRLVNTVKPTWDSEWEKAQVIVYDNAVKDALNVDATLAFASATGRDVHWYYSTDSVRGRVIENEDILEKLEGRSGGESNYLMGKVPLVIGMPVMVTTNFDVEGGVVNGTIGTLKKIRYRLDSQGRRHATACVLQCDDVEYDSPLTGLASNEVVALEHATSFSVKDRHSETYYNIHRRQVPIQPAFAITSHKSQGRTMERVVVDLASCVGTESAYVMLSRATSLDGLLILRPFDIDRITCRPSEDRRGEMRRQNVLRLQTVIDHPVSKEEQAAARSTLESALEDIRTRMDRDAEAHFSVVGDTNITQDKDGADVGEAIRTLHDIEATVDKLCKKVAPEGSERKGKRTRVNVSPPVKRRRMVKRPTQVDVGFGGV